MTTTSPISTSFSPMCYNPSTSTIILFDQWSVPAYSNLETSTYSWTGSNWSLLSSGSYTAPPVRSEAAMGYDFVGSKLAVFGGKGEPNIGYYNDVWTTTAATSWSNTIASYTSGSPAIRGKAMMASMTTGILMFGGVSLFPWIYQDSWLYASGVWTNLEATVFSPVFTAPPVRYNAAFASNASGASGGTTAVLFGGQGTNGVLGDLWQASSVSTSGITWTQLTIAGTAPSYRSGMAMVWYNPGGYYLCYGGQDSAGNLLGDTYSLTISGTTGTFALLIANGSSSQFEPANATGCQLASDGTSNTILFGGRTSKLDLNTTWKWNGTTWTQQ